MRALFVMDPLESLDVSLDTSVGLMHAVQERGGEVWVTFPPGLEARSGEAWAYARRIKLAPSYPDSGCRWTVPDPWYDAAPEEYIALDELDAVFVRLEPPVDPDYLAATYVLDLVSPGVAMVNDPRGLRACSEHLLPLSFPALIPPTLTTARPAAVRDFLASHRVAVVKPVDGFSGRGVFLLREWDPNASSIIDTATARGARSVVVQPYLASVQHGNKRIYLVDGVAVGATLRYPVPGDFRIVSPDSATSLTARDHEIVDAIAPTLRQHGLRCVGLDVIGDRLIEVNVTSPGALRKADALLGTTYCTDLVDHLISHPVWKEAS